MIWVAVFCAAKHGGLFKSGDWGTRRFKRANAARFGGESLFLRTYKPGASARESGLASSLAHASGLCFEVCRLTAAQLNSVLPIALVFRRKGRCRHAPA